MRTAAGVLVILMFASVALLLTNVACFAADAGTTITSDTLEYLADMKKYVAKGSVKVSQEGATAYADEMTLFEETGEIHARGNVRYDDSLTSFTAQSAEINMERRTGKLYHADVLFKEDNYHISGSVLERTGEREFTSIEEVRFTTCDGIPPAWCFRGRDIDLSIGKRLIAKGTSFMVRDVPVFYTPYFWAPVQTERQTGFLMPEISNSSSRGFGLNIPFYWLIDENRDATFVLDTYTKRGIGTGLEYRFVEPGGIRGDWWAYHIWDTELEKDYVEVKGLQENRAGDGAGWFLDVNYVNEEDFYREYNPHKEKQIQRFLQSSGEFSLPFEKSRLYLLAQYWVDLKDDTGDAPQRLPELGYVMHYTRFGNFMISADATAANFWRTDGISADRLDVYPRVLHSLGSDVVLSQKVAVRGTAYAFWGHDNTESDLTRTGFEYDGNIHARLYRKYEAFTHVIEPMLRYHYISSSDNDIPVFDSVEYFKKRSLMALSVLNRFLVKGRELAAVRVTQPVDTYNGDRPFLPLVFELGTRRPLPMKVSATYDTYSGMIKTVSSDVSIPFQDGAFNFSQRYNRENDIMVYKAGITVKPVRAIEMGVSAWYDAKGEGLTKLATSLSYISQCWGVRIVTSTTPDDFTLQVIFDLFGVTAKAPRAKQV
jgi:LPS-assembly protein